MQKTQKRALALSTATTPSSYNSRIAQPTNSHLRVALSSSSVDSLPVRSVGLGGRGHSIWNALVAHSPAAVVATHSAIFVFKKGSLISYTYTLHTQLVFVRRKAHLFLLRA
jgi:hypothetical protein